MEKLKDRSKRGAGSDRTRKTRTKEEIIEQRTGVGQGWVGLGQNKNRKKVP